MKKIVIISSSLRGNSNSERLAKAFEKGASEAGNEVEFISLRGKKLNFCLGCFGCQRTKRCVIEDDANAITDKILEADVVVWATPIYYYEMSGQMKVVIDRANSLYTRDYKFREVYLLATATDTAEHTPEGAKKGVQGWIDCFQGVGFKETLFVGGVTNPGDIEGNIGLTKAYELGKRV